MVKNYFAVMGFDIQRIDELLRSEDWQEQLKRRYRLLCRAVHPDKVASWGDLSKRFDKRELSDYCTGLMAEVNEAYETLSDREKRNSYLLQVLQSTGRLGIFEKSKMSEVMKYALREQNNS